MKVCRILRRLKMKTLAARFYQHLLIRDMAFPTYMTHLQMGFCEKETWLAYFAFR